jgi:hypothetical protein
VAKGRVNLSSKARKCIKKRLKFQEMYGKCRDTLPGNASKHRDQNIEDHKWFTEGEDKQSQR